MNFRLTAIAIALVTVNATASEELAYSFTPEFVAAMERDLGIAEADLPRHIQAEEAAIEIEQLAQSQLGDSFAGSWLEPLANGEYRYVVATSGNNSRVAINGVDVMQVRYSLAQLDASVEALNDTIAKLNSAPVLMREFDNQNLSGIHSWYVDVKNNAIVVAAAADAEKTAIDFIAASGVDIDMVRIEESEGQPMTAVNVYGGRSYGSGGGSCSIGFAVTRGSTKGFVTAGHCGSAGTRVSVGGVNVGSVQGSRFPTDDLAWANVRSSDTLLPFVNRYNGGTVQDIRVRGTNVASIGSTVCRSGFASGYRCGRINARNVTVNYSVGPVFGLTQSSACLTQGDSGGSWITGAGQAQGVSSGGQLGGGTPPLSNCQFSNPVSYFQPVREILNRYSLTITR